MASSRKWIEANPQNFTNRVYNYANTEHILRDNQFQTSKTDLLALFSRLQPFASNFDFDPLKEGLRELRAVQFKPETAEVAVPFSGPPAVRECIRRIKNASLCLTTTETH